MRRLHTNCSIIRAEGRPSWKTALSLSLWFGFCSPAISTIIMNIIRASWNKNACRLCGKITFLVHSAGGLPIVDWDVLQAQLFVMTDKRDVLCLYFLSKVRICLMKWGFPNWAPFPESTVRKEGEIRSLWEFNFACIIPPNFVKIHSSKVVKKEKKAELFFMAALRHMCHRNLSPTPFLTTIVSRCGLAVRR